MGRKGVSKRKPSQTKSKPWSSGSGSSIVQAAESQVVKSTDTGKAVPSTRESVKPAIDWKKKTRKS